MAPPAAGGWRQRHGSSRTQPNRADSAAAAAARHLSARQPDARAQLAGTAAVRDSIDLWLRTLTTATLRPARQHHALARSARSVAVSPGATALALAVDLRAGANGWIRERAVLIDTLRARHDRCECTIIASKAMTLRPRSTPTATAPWYRVARGFTQRTRSGTVILVFEAPNRLTRWVDGFAYENR